jgi:hypothetical protein
MELREQIDEAKTGQHVETIRQRADSIKTEVIRELDVVFSELIPAASSSSSNNDEKGSGETRRQHLQSRAKHLSVKLKYLYGVEKACTEWYFSQ